MNEHWNLSKIIKIVNYIYYIAIMRLKEIIYSNVFGKG